jgi:hypothetical protein
VKKAQQKVHRYRLAANEAREKQGLFGVWVKRAYSDGFTRRSSDRGRKPRSSQFLKALFGFRQRASVTRVELVPAVTTMIHLNLGRHGKLLAIPLSSKANSMPCGRFHGFKSLASEEQQRDKGHCA